MKRSLLVVTLAIMLASLMSAQTKPDPKNLKFRGDRFKPLTWDEMTPEQHKMVEDLVAGPRSDPETYWTVVKTFSLLGDAAAAREWTTRARSRFPRDPRFRR